MSTVEIPKSFFFQFEMSCLYLPKLGGAGGPPDLDENYRLPSFAELEKSGPKIEDSPPVDFRIGWNEKGLALSIAVSGKKQQPWCRLAQPEESDGVQICLDTRDVRNVHRATRFCHRFVFLPLGGGTDGREPVVFWFPIHRAKAHPNAVETERIKIRGRLLKEGYQLDVVLPEDVLTGYEPAEFPRLGFHYAVLDREIGNHYLLVGPPFPHDNDPSLWGTLDFGK